MASAADLPRVVKTTPVAPVFDWTGFYLGANYGVGVSQTHGTSTPDVSGIPGQRFDRGGKGFAAGVQGGYDWQVAPELVFGLAADIGWLGIDRVIQDFADVFIVGIETDWYATARARLGYTNGPSLFYLTGGAAWVNVDAHDNVPAAAASKSRTASGWTGGWGIETRFGGNWTSFAEYLFVDAGSLSLAQPAAPLPRTTYFDNRFHIFRQGLSYRWGGGAAPAALPAYNWSGYYVGVNGGVGASRTNYAPPNPLGTGDIADSGFTGGVQAGFNWHLAPAWVVGIEGDLGWLGIDRTNIDWTDPSVAFGVKTDWYGTIRGRLGYSTGPALLYVTGGAAFVRVTNRFNGVTPPSSASKSSTESGWVLGGGIEAALGNNWSAKTEYLYIDTGSQTVVNPVAPGADTISFFDNRFHVFRFGLNYRFASGKAPPTVVSKY